MSAGSINSIKNSPSEMFKDTEHNDIMLIVTLALLSCTSTLCDAALTRAKGQEGLAEKEKHLSDEILGVKYTDVPDFKRDDSWKTTSDTWYWGAFFLSKHLTAIGHEMVAKLAEYIQRGGHSEDVWIDRSEGKIYMKVAGHLYRGDIWPDQSAQYYLDKIDSCDDSGLRRFTGSDNSAEVQQALQVNKMQQNVRNALQGQFGVFNQLCGEENARMTATAEATSTTFAAINDCLSLMLELCKKVVLPYNTAG